MPVKHCLVCTRPFQIIEGLEKKEYYMNQKKKGTRTCSHGCSTKYIRISNVIYQEIYRKFKKKLELSNEENQILRTKLADMQNKEVF